MDKHTAIANEIARLRNDAHTMNALSDIREGLRLGDSSCGWHVMLTDLAETEAVFENHTFVGLGDDEILRFVATCHVAKFGS